nr:two-component regulator propeller domain-containing protein [uncultured Arsenicibacter sp.]
MEKMFTCRLVVILFFSGLYVCGFAQTDPVQFRFEHLTVNEGLSHSDAMAVVQDQQGFIWVATNKGIDRYDGYEIKPYLLPIDNENGLSNNRVRSLHVSPEGTLWAGTEGGGLNVYNLNQDRFMCLHMKPGTAGSDLLQLVNQSEIAALAVDSQGRVWAGTRQHGVFIVQAGTDGEVQWIKQIKLATPRSRFCEITDLIIDKAGTVWIAAARDGLFTIPARQPDAVAGVVTAFTGKYVRALAPDRQNGLWVATDSQVMWMPAGTRAKQVVDPFVLPQTFRSIDCLHRDSFGRLWIGTNFGLLMLPVQVQEGKMPVVTDKVTTYLPLDTDPFSINSGRIHCIFEDRFQVLWLAASAGGLNKIDLRQKPFGHLSRQPSQQPTLANNYINALYKEDARNLLWIATRNGISSYDLTHKVYQNYFSRPLPGNVTGMDVACIFQDTDSTLWFGTQNDGLLALRRRHGQVRFTTYNPQGDLFQEVESIVEDKFGTIWTATFDHGLTRLDHEGKVLATYTMQNSGLPTDRFTFLLYDKPTNILWASTQNAGVLKLKVWPDKIEVLRQFKHDTHDPGSLRVNYAWPLLKDRHGVIWVGTIGGGLHRIVTGKDGREVVSRCTSWLPDSDVESILEDNEGNLWLGSEGLIRVNTATHRVLRYNVADGIQSNSFKIGAACRASDETLFFGGINGITFLKPCLIQSNPYPPFVQLTGFAIQNQPVHVGQEINGRVLVRESLNHTQGLEIKDNENDFSVSFVGLNFANPQKNHYAYQLVGYNDKWIPLSANQRTVSFTNLPAGDYTFQVKADNGEGVWTHKPATLQLTILPPWWKTWVAYAIYTLVLITVLLLARHILLRQQALENKVAFEHFQYEKEKELSHLKLEFFTHVSHEIRTPLTLILGPMEELAASAWKFNGMKDKVLLVHQQTRRLLSLINQLLDFRKMESQQIALQASQHDIIPFVTELFLMFQLKAEEQRLHYTIDVPPAIVPVYFDRNKLEVAIINVLSNALKYTPAERGVHLRVVAVGDPSQDARYDEQRKLQTNFLEIVIVDEGVGIKPEELEKVFDVYYQASHSASMRVVGTGIGLSLVKQFIERHGGEVQLTSRINAGTTFTIRLPFGKQHLTPADLLTQETYPSPAALVPADHAFIVDPSVLMPASLRLLIVEDNSDVREYITQLFAAKFDVHTAADGLEGWEKATRLVPDLIISDIMMPQSDGLELCKKVKQEPKTMHIPVLLLTARAAVIHEIEGLELGADEYISKPFNPDVLTAKVNTLVYNRLKIRQYYQQKILLEPTDISIPDGDRVFLETAMAIVEKNLMEPDFSVQELVKAMAMSRSVFYRKIKSITGQSVVEFINDIRMRRAAKLLISSQLRVFEVCTLVGLEDLKYFRKAFQQVHGVSPSEYARKHRAEKEMQPAGTD